ncbi:MAG: hypothetical protein LBC09_03905 [Helicobacteraceae bacterium]|nr:hypothetical protein [Helicobacteraceae bacterium]
MRLPIPPRPHIKTRHYSSRRLTITIASALDRAKTDDGKAKEEEAIDDRAP